MRLVNYLSVTGLSAGIALFAIPSNAQNVSIPDLFPTGVDDFGVLLGDGIADPNYNILETTSSGIVVNQANIPSVWFPNNSNSRWIWETATGQPTGVTRTFRTTFDLTGFDPNTASISGEWAVDNQGLDILINGISTGQTSSGFRNLDSFSINEGFVSGLNTLDFIARDFGVISGFRVDSISGNAELITEPEPVPEPSSLLGLVVGLLGTASLKRTSEK